MAFIALQWPFPAAPRSFADMPLPSWDSFRRSFGPGLLWAAAAIGVSHLVQSTRAGADAGFGLAALIALALLLKYPFFEFGPRYAAATGESLIEGYLRIGRWALWLYFMITAATAVFVVGAILLFTAYLFIYAFAIDAPLWLIAGALYVACAVLLRAGRFGVFDLTVKALMVLLAASTLVAAAIALPRADFGTFALWPAGDAVGFGFVLALVGWMPSGMDVAAWSSLWTLAKDDAEDTTTDVRTARLDFLVGYLGTGLLALAFLALGTAIMHGAGASFSAQGTAFATQLVELYVATLGPWARPVVIAAVLTTMLTTAITVIDGFPRALDRAVRVLMISGRRRREGVRPDVPLPLRTGTIATPYWTALVLIGIAAILALARFAGTLARAVDLATTISFLTAPVLGWLNLRAIRGDVVPAEHRPGRAMLVWSWIGLALLGGTGALFLVGLLR